MLDLETAAAEFHAGLDGHVVAKARWLQKSRVRLHQRPAGEFQILEHLELGHPQRALEQRRGRGIEDFEITRIKNNAGRVAVAPFDAYRAGVAESHVSARRQAYRAVEADDLAVEIAVADAMHDKVRELARITQAFGERHRGAKRILRLLWQSAQHRRAENSRRYGEHAHTEGRELARCRQRQGGDAAFGR